MEEKIQSFIDKINNPEDLRKLNSKELAIFCGELRQFLIDHASRYGGHFASSLGVVELTVALHYIFNTPDDKIVWDVGHQAYAHKILTGRKDTFYTNRTKDGISPFPKPVESEYDTFTSGHASVSISAALGMAMASMQEGNTERQHIAVIGDGALTGGAAFEGLNNAGASKSNILVILNDNNMSIDQNVGALKEYLTGISASPLFNKFRDEVSDTLGKFNKLGKSTQVLVHKLETSMKGLISQQSNFFESLNFRYFGTVDGHNIEHLTKILQDLKHIQGPKLLHILTKKGKGFSFAEADPLTWHAPAGIFDIESGELLTEPSTEQQPLKYQEVFGHTLLELARQNEKIVGITPAMPSGCSLDIMMKEMPDRCFDVGIAEGHAVTFSAGLATQGLIPFCNIYSSFMQRAYDQVIHDVCISNVPVIFCLDRGGLVGADGPTHHGTFDLAYFRCIPNLIVSAPMDEWELRNLMFTAQKQLPGPISIRYPRGKGIHVDWQHSMQEIKIGTGRILSEGDEIVILSIGTTGVAAQKAVQAAKKMGENIGHFDMRFVKPLDIDLLKKACHEYQNIITIEDGTLMGGFGSAILEAMQEHDLHAKVVRLGIPDHFISHATPDEQFEECGIDLASIQNAISELKAGLSKKI